MFSRNQVKFRGVLAGVFIGLGLAAFVTVWWNNDKYSIKQPIMSYGYGKNNFLVNQLNGSKHCRLRGIFQQLILLLALEVLVSTFFTRNVLFLLI